jgi:3D (Asp-Asp-Asp) domain-containing protein/phage FluMu protein gp41
MDDNIEDHKMEFMAWFIKLPHGGIHRGGFFMSGFEAAKSIQPQKSTKYYKLINKKKSGYSWAVLLMFSLVALLCINNYILLDSYRDLKGKLFTAYDEINKEKQTAQKLTGIDSELEKQVAVLTEENRKMKENYNKASRGSDDLSRQIEAIKKQNSELSRQIKTLTNDNIALQNSLKMAASVGIKPQSYLQSAKILPRSSISRGKYVGRFLGTAYTPSKEECGNNKGITKSGQPIMPGVTVAIDNRYWPFGTVFYIRGIGYVVAMDTGSAIKGKYRFDFSVFDKKFAKMLGTRKWDVYLVKKGTGKVNSINL